MQKMMVLWNWTRRACRFARRRLTLHDGVWEHGNTLELFTKLNSAREIYGFPSGVRNLKQ
jgi:hypothetical protein